MENTYSNGSYIPRASPSYSDSIGPLSPSYAGSHLNSNSNELNEDRSNQSKEMNRYPQDNRGDYTAYAPSGPRDSDRSTRPDDLHFRHPGVQKPGSYDSRDRYDDRRDPYDDRRNPYDDRRDPSNDRRDAHDDHYRGTPSEQGSYRRDNYGREAPPGRGQYDEKSDSYRGPTTPYDDKDSHKQDSESYRHDDRYDDLATPKDGVRHPQYDDDGGGPPSQSGYNGGYENKQAELDDVQLKERTDDRYNVKKEAVELAYAPPVLKGEMDSRQTKLKPKSIKEKWKQKSKSERRKYCALFVCLVLTAVAIIVVPMAIYVRLWHKLTWDDIRRLQVQPRDIKWGLQGRYVYYRDFTNNIIRVDLSKQNSKSQEIIVHYETWNKVQFDDFDVTGPGTMVVFAKNNGTSLLHMNFVDLYKYEIGDKNNEPQKFQTHVVNWEVVTHKTENRIVFVQQDQPSNAYNIRLQEMGPAIKTLKNIGSETQKPSYLRGLLSFMYSQEFFGGVSKGFWVAPDGDYIVFMETDVSTVRGVTIQSGKDSSKGVTYPYPFAGENNPMVKLRLYYVLEDEIISGADEPLDPAGKQDKHYITAVSFPNSQKLLVEFMNRQQTRARSEECTMSLSPTCVDLRVLHRNSYFGWLPRYEKAAHPAQKDPDSQQYYVLRPRVDKQLNFTHLHKYETTNDPNRKIAITSGEFAVTKIIGTDHTRENVLYIRTEDMNLNYESTSTTQKRMLYLYHAPSESHTCISCLEPSSRCDVASADIDITEQWYFLTCLGAGVPYRRIKSFHDHSWNVYSDDNQNIQYADPSTQAQLLQKKSPRVVYEQVELDRNSKMWFAVKKIFPLYYVYGANILKYPLLIWVDPYPDGNMAIKKYQLGLAEWLATSKDCIVMYMDVRGTPGRGLEWHHYPYKDFQKIVDKSRQAIEDIRTYWHVDTKNVAIIGEGLGGWLALKIAQAEPSWFSAVVAVNPILNFKRYLSAYSERYLESFGSNEAKYKTAAIDLADYPKKSRSKTAIYYDPTNSLVPHTYSTISKFLEKETLDEEYQDFSGFNLYNILSVEDASEGLSDDVFVNIGEHVTTFLSTSPHDIF